MRKHKTTLYDVWEAAMKYYWGGFGSVEEVQELGRRFREEHAREEHAREEAARGHE